MINAICGGSRLVKSEGVIKQTGEMHAITCTIAGGMSGSPVITMENGLHCVSGMLCGGPAAPLHRSLIDLISKIQDSDWSSANLILHNSERLPDLSLFANRTMFEQMKTVLLARNTYCLDIILKIYNEVLTRYILKNCMTNVAGVCVEDRRGPPRAFVYIIFHTAKCMK